MWNPGVEREDGDGIFLRRSRAGEEVYVAVEGRAFGVCAEEGARAEELRLVFRCSRVVLNHGRARAGRVAGRKARRERQPEGADGDVGECVARRAELRLEDGLVALFDAEADLALPL